MDNGEEIVLPNVQVSPSVFRVKTVKTMKLPYEEALKRSRHHRERAKRTRNYRVKRVAKI